MPKDECLICNGAFEKQVVKKYRYWTVSLHANQSLLGRCSVSLNRHEEEFDALTVHEEAEMFRVVRQLARAEREAFAASRVNYVVLGNLHPHVHLHVLPRYSGERGFAGTRFEDAKWGKNPYPLAERSFPAGVLTAIKKELRRQLEE